jgi:hypothetical protein
MGTDRKLDKTFRSWLEECHRDLDKTCIYQDPLPNVEMQRFRRQFGHAKTFFKRVTDGSRTIEVRIFHACLSGSSTNLRPSLMRTTAQNNSGGSVAARFGDSLRETELHSG